MAYDGRKEALIENDKKNGDKSQKRGGDTQAQEDSDEYTKGLILSFTVKKVGAADATEKPSEKADTDNKSGATDEPAENADTKIEVEAADDKSAEDADTEKAAEAADTENADGTDKAADTEEKLSREDIKDALTEYGIIRVGHPYHTPKSANHSFFM